MAGGAPLTDEALSAWFRPMTRCECAGLSFEEIARRMREEGLPLEEICEKTGCGQCCSACLPDLRDHLCKTP
jgi:bacterioferritin-associated ferredoxin